MSDFPKELCFDFNAPLNRGDSESTTYGCRHTNPDICGSCYLENICAFCTSSHLCLKPSVRWKKQYIQLKEENKQ